MAPADTGDERGPHGGTGHPVAAASVGGEGELAGCVRALAAEGRDCEGKLLPAGTLVLFNPLARDEFLEDTEANQRRFLENDCAWTPAVRTRVWFPRASGLSDELGQKLHRAEALRQTFLAAVHKNLQEAAERKEPLPETDLPRRLLLLPWEPKVLSVRELADLTRDHRERTRAAAGVPDSVAWPKEWDERCQGLNPVKVYQVSGSWIEMHVVVAYVTPILFRKGAEPVLGQFDGPRSAAVVETYQEWRRDRGITGVEFTFFTCGSASPGPDDLEGLAAGDYSVQFAWPGPDATWETRVPPCFASSASVRDFFDRLKPETREQRVSRVKSVVDGFFDGGYPGHVTVEKVKARTGYRQSAVLKLFLALQASGHYRLHRTGAGGIAIRQAAAGAPIEVRASAFARSFLQRHGWSFAVSSIGVAVWVLKDLFVSGRFDLAGLPVLLCLAYAGSCVQSRINRHALDKEV